MNTQHERPRLLLTGAAGSLARDVIPGLIAAGWDVVGLDTGVPSDKMGCAWVQASLNDRPRLLEECEGLDAIVHLAGIPLEAPWGDILAANIDGTQAILEAARMAGVGKVVLASSIHAVGFVPVPSGGELVTDSVAPRPNTFYGVSKAAVEALGSMYSDRFGLDIVCLRIASRFAQPMDQRMLSTWLSPRDATHLFLAALHPEVQGFHLVWGVSANTRAILSPDGGKTIGYKPLDDAEWFATDMLPASGNPSESALAGERLLGGPFSSSEPPTFRGLPVPYDQDEAKTKQMKRQMKEIQK